MDTEGIVKALKKIVDKKSLSHLKGEPYEVYRQLVDSYGMNQKDAASVLYVLLSGVKVDEKDGNLSDRIRRECGLLKDKADWLAEVFHALFSEEHRKEWKQKDKEGLKQFLAESFTCKWEGSAVWDAGNGTVDCYFNAVVTLEPTKEVCKDEKLICLLQENPFSTKEDIHEHFAKRLEQYLDDQFENYCTCEDYYQPVVEDFECDLSYDLQKWAEKNGFEYVDFEGEGGDLGYEPKFRRW